MFYSAVAELDACRATDTLDHMGDPAYWIVVPVAPDVALHFAVLNAETGLMGRIISAITQSAAFHVETWLGDAAPEESMQRAEEIIYPTPFPYDWEGSFRSFDNSGYHTTGREFCSGMAYELLSPLLPHLLPYPNPGKLLADVTAMCGIRMDDLPPALTQIGDAEVEYLNELHDSGKISCGILQETLQAFPTDETEQVPRPADGPMD